MSDQKFQKSHLKIFLSYYKPHLGLFILDMICALGISLVDLAFPFFSRFAMNQLLPQSLMKGFFAIMLGLVAAYALRAGMQFIVTFYGHLMGVRIEADIRRDVFGHMQDLSFSFYDKNRTGQLMSRATTDLFEITELAHHGPEDLITSIVTILGALIVMATIQWRLALVVGITIPILLAVVMGMRRNMGRVSKGVKEKTGHINTEIESSLSGFRTSKAFANEDQENARFRKANGQYVNAKRSFHKAMGMFHSSMEFFLCSLNVVVIGYGGFLIMEGQLQYTDLLTFTLYITAFINPMRKISGFSEMFANGFAGLNRFHTLMNTEPSLQDKEDAAVLTDVKGEITVKDVSFAYKEDLDVLKDVSITVAPGETIAIVGPSGGGKTTLCQLIPRFYDVDSGSICIDGLDIRDVTQKSLHKNIGIVQQDVFLFADTVFENIRYGKPDASMEEVVEAARKAEILDDILAMPQGFDTYVGERGTLLSGGQKQRIAIARIFLKNPPILILDEATSALDSVTEAKIQRAFDALAQGRTTLIIAHRLSTIRNAGRIVSISDGVIAECGTHQELLDKGGIYADLYTTQTSLQ